MSGQPCKKEMLDHINAVSFSALEAQLYLNTHPCDKCALESFYECNKMRNKALREYATYYGPLTIDTATASCSDRWNWIQEPWPWQEGGC
ncbi:MAG: spore coat protein CotJB [Hespellia sp.]|nr:spore coat protein CotJB [Hespellia sp.]